MAEETMNLFRKGMPIFGIFQDENRQKIILLLCKNKELTVNQITEQINLSRPAVSHHLKLMLDAGVIAVNKVGKERLYRVSLDDTVQLLKDLTVSLENSISSK
ncbi:transcription regulator [Companilactobacillus paralimentarius DSM 13238 = JCM 10415]|jgi:Predicted transcriptional regulators|uniref:HTH arsR-type domain-containing protein n=3 Tax=Companilactobacillus TaxID=2767879 RepID=A0A202FG99_9LACO|nr:MULTISPECIES: metalloregulator ArsR/SmtB family transcription factor [Companilactobacillus]KAE9560153.1 ArsR family transcriptional regulator [Companilactobacillus bobalius]KAE9564144.1 ArsR family transcriptional regulator [Companilactobacillus paralimentarius]KRK82832.1 transcription regulator [Companilactobacillus bobalius DSM 19674]KRL31643.1 transcription regulator [Companilactobacillus paralimentarius DSM 13238 = JCM 10415]MDR4933662.1 metalloregulator ArsR/SmtB family transcription f